MSTEVLSDQSLLPVSRLDVVDDGDLAPSSVSNSEINHAQILLCPALLPFLPFQQLVCWSELSKEYEFVVKNYATDIGYYQALCVSFCGEHGLYLPQMKNAKSYFFNEIWVSRLKWRNNDDQSDFKIRVSSRFSPGTRSNEKIELPLHQFLAVRRKQLKEKEEERNGGDGNNNKDVVFVGESIPEEYLDPLMGTLMIDPVRLPGSQRVVDRSVAINSVLRGGKDPFDNSKLDFTMLIPMPELAEELRVFKIKQEKNNDVGVKTDDAMQLVKHLDPALLEALVAAEQLECASKRAVYDEWENNHLQAAGGAQYNHPNVDNVNGNGDDHENPEVDVAHVDGAEDGIVPLANNFSADERTEADLDVESGVKRESQSSGPGPRWRKERSETSARILDTNRDKSCVTMHVPGSGVRPFHFNNVFIDKTNQQTVYDDSARDLVTAALNGMNSCLLCYGQTGSGKTYTMFGPDDVCSNVGKVTGDRIGKSDLEIAESIISSKSSTGIVFRACAELLRAKAMFERRGNVSMNLNVQFVEIYNDVVTDLMSGKRLSVKRQNGELNGAVETEINSIDSVINLLNEGHTRKHFASTAMNERSSRSHTAFIVQISQSYHDVHDKSSSDHKLLKSQLYLVDLAGSERVKKSKAMGTQLTEARSINSSLLVLGKVITRLSRSDIHVPYFESQLTTLLKGAFGGNSKTGVIVTCRSDDKTHGDETLQSLRFGEQCGMITNATRQAASCSIEALLASLDSSIEKVGAQLQSLKDRGKQHLPSFRSLENKLTELKTRRQDVEKVTVVTPTSSLSSN